jgi:uncharacterized protein YdeI (YjbR/CyaY-like superfamily)
VNDVVYFRNAAGFRRWLENHHAKAREVWVGFYKKDSGKPGISYPEAVDQALCYGWIDGVRKAVDDVSYKNRFSPRKTRSVWSLINIRRVGELTKMGLMAEPGLAAFKGRDPKRSGMYSFENRPASLTPALQKKFTADKEAWSFFKSQPPGYRRVATWFVMSAKRDETRLRRLERLMEDSRHQRRLAMLAPKGARAL